MWPSTLSSRLLIVALAGRYPANKLIRRGPIPYRYPFAGCAMRHCRVMRYYQPFPAAVPLYGAGCPRVTHPSATQSACLPPGGFRHAASFDLHVLSTPPAFILSQDQTLILKFSLQNLAWLISVFYCLGVPSLFWKETVREPVGSF